MDPADELADAHGFSIRHRQEILDSYVCGCFYCQAMFVPAEIARWCDEGQTALCPECGIDSVIGAASGLRVDPDFLQRMHDRWF